MRRTVFLLILAGACLWWAASLMTTRRVIEFLDAHPTRLNPSIEYFWGMALSLMQDTAGAEERFARVVERYPTSSRAPQAAYERIETLYMANDYPALRDAAAVFLQRFPDHPRAETVRRKLVIANNNS